MSLFSSTIDSSVSLMLSYLSNQKAWQGTHRSMATVEVMRASNVMAVISVAQFGQFIGVVAPAFVALFMPQKHDPFQHAIPNRKLSKFRAGLGGANSDHPILRPLP